MSPASVDSTGRTTGKIARKLFIIFFVIAMIPFVVIFAAALGYARGLFQQLSLVDQQRSVIMLVGCALAVAGLMAVAARRFARPINDLLRTVAMYVEGSWEQRVIYHGNDEIGRLAHLFNQIADEMSEFQHLLMARENDPGDNRRQAPIQLAQIAANSASLDDLLGGSLDVFIKNFACSYAAVYLIERKEPAGVSFAVLTQSRGSLENEAPDLAERLKVDRVNLDTTPTMDWLVGRAIASRRPQVGATQDDTGIFEATLPIIQSVAGNGGRVLGVLDLFTVSRVKDSRLGPFSIRYIAEMQSLTGILALGLSNFARTPGTTNLVATGKLSSFLPDLETVFTTSRRMSQAETSEEIVEAMCQALRTSPFSSAVLMRPDEVTVESNTGKVPMRVVECRSSRGRPLVSQASADTIVSPRLDTVERFFLERHNEMLLISDINQAVMSLDRNAEWQSPAPYLTGLEDPLPPRELVLIARWLGCRTAAFLPAVQHNHLVAILLIGSTPDMPPLTTKAELLEPYRDLLSMASASLERIQSQQNTHRQIVELETFWRISQAIALGNITAETSMEELYALIHHQVERAMGVISSFAIVLYEPTTNLVRIPYMIEEEQRLTVAPFPLGPGFSSEIIRTRKSLLMFTQAEIDAKTQELDAMQVGEAPKSWLGVPMLFSGQVIGLIIVQDVKQEFRFTNQDERLLNMLAAQVAVVVRNAHLLEETRRQARQERLVNEISDRIRRQVDVDSILKITTAELSRVLGARRTTMRIDPQLVVEPLAGHPSHTTSLTSDLAPPSDTPSDLLDDEAGA